VAGHLILAKGKVGATSHGQSGGLRATPMAGPPQRGNIYIYIYIYIFGGGRTTPKGLGAHAGSGGATCRPVRATAPPRVKINK
jgi:hypothetical protein